MRQVTGSMAGVVRGMEGAMRTMDLEKVSPLFFPRIHYNNSPLPFTAFARPLILREP